MLHKLGEAEYESKLPRPSYPLRCSLLIMISPGWNPWGRNGDANTDLWTQQGKERVDELRE